MSNALVYPFMRYTTVNPETGEKKYLSAGIFTEMRERLKKYEEPQDDGHYTNDHFKLVLDDMVTECGVDVLFHSSVYAAQTYGRKVTCVKAATKSGSMDFYAK